MLQCQSNDSPMEEVLLRLEIARSSRVLWRMAYLYGRVESSHHSDIAGRTTQVSRILLVLHSPFCICVSHN